MIEFLRILERYLKTKGLKSLSKDNLKKLFEVYKKEIAKYKNVLRGVITAEEIEALKSLKYDKRVFNELARKGLPQNNALHEIIKKLNLDYKEFLKYENNPGALADRLRNLSKKDMTDITDAMKEDINEAPLSSSWLAYGSFVPVGSDSLHGRLRLTTKDGTKFETGVTERAVWEAMKNQVGVTTYYKGKRSAEHGAGTILWRYVPRSSWKKISSAKEANK